MLFVSLFIFSNNKNNCIIYVGERMKKIMIICITILLVIFFSILLLVLKNDNYTKNIEKEIMKNYSLKEEIKYLNKFNLYYIIVTTENLIVLDNNYQEVFKDKKVKIEKDKELVYRLNKVMYEKTEIIKDKVVYKYYDVYTNDLIDSVEIGG